MLPFEGVPLLYIPLSLLAPFSSDESASSTVSDSSDAVLDTFCVYY